MDPGLSKRTRDVGLIQDPQTLEQTVTSMQHTIRWIRHMGTGHLDHPRGEPWIQRWRLRGGMNRIEPDRFKCLYKHKETGPVHFFLPSLSLQSFRERCSAISLHLLRWTRRRRCGGSPAAPPHLNIFRNFLHYRVHLSLLFTILKLVFQNEAWIRTDLRLHLRLRVSKFSSNLFETNPILTYFTCWWWIYALIRRINGESSWFLELGFHFNFFRILSNFHFNSPFNLSFKTFDDDYELNEKDLCTYLSWFGDSNEILQITLNLGCVLDASGKLLHRNWK
jgi:hypothetical protein